MGPVSVLVPDLYHGAHQEEQVRRLLLLQWDSSLPENPLGAALRNARHAPQGLSGTYAFPGTGVSVRDGHRPLGFSPEGVAGS
jgi:hypothetical protein